MPGAGSPAERGGGAGRCSWARCGRGRGERAAEAADETVKLVLWRHGQTTWNVERRFQGQSDVPLNDAGVAQAVVAARLLAALGPWRFSARI